MQNSAPSNLKFSTLNFIDVEFKKPRIYNVFFINTFCKYKIVENLFSKVENFFSLLLGTMLKTMLKMLKTHNTWDLFC